MCSEVFVFESGDLFIKSEFADEDIKLLILSGTSSYESIITKAKLDQVQQNLAGKIEHVAEMAQKAFSEASDQHFSLAVEIVGEAKKPVLVWRKLGSVGSKIKLRLATFDLDLVEKEKGELAYKSFVRFLINDSSGLKNSLDEANAKLETKSSELKRTLQLSEDLSEEQLTREEELIKQFLPILNNKKRRIEELENQLARGDQGQRPDDSYDAETDDEDIDTDVDDPNITEDNHYHLNMTDDKDDLTMTNNASGSKRKLQDSNGKGEPEKNPKIDHCESFEEDLFDNL